MNNIDAINLLAIPDVTYRFSIIKWNFTDTACIDSKIYKLLTKHCMHHPKADVDEIYHSRKVGGHGFIQLEISFKTSITCLVIYLETTPD